MSTKTGYAIVSDRLISNLRTKNETNEVGIQVKLGFGTPEERLNQINRTSQVCFIMLGLSGLEFQEQETKFRHYLQHKFQLKARENSNEEFHISESKFVEINDEHKFVDIDLKSIVEKNEKYDFFCEIIKCMIKIAKDNYESHIQIKPERKRGRVPDDDGWSHHCDDYKKFVEVNARKPRTTQNQIVSFGEVLDREEGKLGDWYTCTKQRKHMLSSIRSLPFGELQDFLKETIGKT
jgi:hypothetical protein